MSTALQLPDYPRHLANPAQPAPQAPQAPSAFARAQAPCRFSTILEGPVGIEAEPGLVVRVHAGCLWVPDPQAQCSVGVSAGEQMTLSQKGSILAHAMRGVEIELLRVREEGAPGPQLH